MNLMITGINHKSAPVAVRERLAIPARKLAEATQRLLQTDGVREGLILSTCNRVEVLAICESGQSLREFLIGYGNAGAQAIDPLLYEYSERDAVRHLFKVVCSLDSMIVGEPQILGQVKEAYNVAREAGGIHSEMESVLSRAFAVAKRVRTETSIGMSAVSVASAAVALAKEIFGTLEGKQVFLVGAGKMSELAAQHLIANGADSIFVANRTHEHAVELAQQFGGSAIHFDELYERADRADIVITSTGAPHAIFRRDHGVQFLQRRRNRPMFFIDIAVPRDVAPEMSSLDGIFVYNIDDLQSVVDSNRSARSEEAARAHRIIEEELERFAAHQRVREVAPTISSLQEHVENIRRAEVQRVRGRLGSLTPEQELALESLTRGIINKVLHTPITALKSAAREAQSAAVIEAVQKVFNLSSSAAASANGAGTQTSEKKPEPAEEPATHTRK